MNFAFIFFLVFVFPNRKALNWDDLTHELNCTKFALWLYFFFDPLHCCRYSFHAFRVELQLHLLNCFVLILRLSNHLCLLLCCLVIRKANFALKKECKWWIVNSRKKSAPSPLPSIKQCHFLFILLIVAVIKIIRTNIVYGLCNLSRNERRVARVKRELF